MPTCRAVADDLSVPVEDRMEALAVQAPALIASAASAMEAVCCAVWDAVPAPTAAVSEAIARAMIQAKNLRSALEEACVWSGAPDPSGE